jgi:hypothetical protein
MTTSDERLDQRPAEVAGSSRDEDIVSRHLGAL